MSDFIARITAKLDSSAAESQIKSLTQKKIVDVELNITNQSQLSNLFKGITVNAGSAGQQAGQAFGRGFASASSRYFESGKPTADFKTFNKQLDQYVNQTSASIQKARSIMASLKDNFELRDLFSTSDLDEDKKHVAEITKEIREQLTQYKNALREVKTETTASLNASDAEIGGNKILKYLRENTRAAEQYGKALQDLANKAKQATTVGAMGDVNKQFAVIKSQIEAQGLTGSFNNSKNIQALLTGKFDATGSSFAKSLSAYVGQDTDALNRARGALADYNAELDKLKVNYGSGKMSESDLENSFNKITTAAERCRNEISIVKNESTASISQLDATTKSNEILTYYNNNTKAVQRYGQALQDLATRAKNAKTQGEIQQINKEFSNLKSTISMEGLTGKTFFDNLSSGLTSFASRFLSVYQAIRVAKSMISDVRAIDSSMTELRKVSNASDADLSKMFDNATESAKKYGVAINEVIDSQADWVRLGYNLKDAEKLAEVTTLFQRVGDNMTQETASSSIISILKGYQMEAEEAEKIVDELTNVANTQPIDTSGLTEALKRSVSSLAVAGNSLEESIGLITSANAVLQDPASVGTFFKTDFVFMYRNMHIEHI